MTADPRVKRRLQVGDYVRKRGDGEVIGIVVHIMKDAGLIVVNFPPSRQGVAFHPDDLSVIGAARGSDR
jgi:hypothetical protein